MNPTLTPVSDAADGASAPACEVLAFRLGDEEYAVDILRVQEIRAYERPTRLAHAPAYVRGVINLRGAIVPIVDLRLKLGVGGPECDGFTVVIVLNAGRRIVGAVVDAVDDVIAIAPAQLRELPGLDGRPLQAVGAVDDRLLILLDPDRLMAEVEIGATTLQ